MGRYLSPGRICECARRKQSAFPDVQRRRQFDRFGPQPRGRAEDPEVYFCFLGRREVLPKYALWHRKRNGGALLPVLSGTFWAGCFHHPPAQRVWFAAALSRLRKRRPVFHRAEKE